MFEKPTTMTEPFKKEHKGKSSSNNMRHMLIGVNVFVLVVGAVVLSLYFGMEISKDNYKEYQAIFVNDFGEVVHENVIVTEKEEIFSNDEATGIADFSTGIITIHITSMKWYAGKCFVTNLNTSDFQTPKGFISSHTTSQITFESNDTVKRMYDITDIWLNNNALGTRSAKLCNDKEITTKVKRAVNGNMVPFPRLHFFMPGFTPLISKGTKTPKN